MSNATAERRGDAHLIVRDGEHLSLHRRVDHRGPRGKRAAMARARPLSCRVSPNGE